MGAAATPHGQGRPRLSDAIVSDLVREILSGRLAPGSVLPSEPELVATYGVSKVVVRESILNLQALGMVTVQQGKRTLVVDESTWDILSPAAQKAARAEGRAEDLIRQLYEARLIIEPAVAVLAAERAAPIDVRELSVLADRLEVIAASAGGLEAFLATDRAFHDRVASAGRNLALRAMMRDLHRYMSFNWEESKTLTSDLQQLAGQHREIFVAIARHDPDGAREAMSRHIAWAGRIETERAT